MDMLKHVQGLGISCSNENVYDAVSAYRRFTTVEVTSSDNALSHVACVLLQAVVDHHSWHQDQLDYQALWRHNQDTAHHLLCTCR